MFRTEIPLTPLSHQLPPSARVLTLGSCFSDAIGARLTEFKVATLVNPFGTVFNPISACKLLRAAAGEDVDWQQHLVEARGRWQSYDLHAEIGADSPVELLQHINQLTREVGVFLATADVVVLTLGSAFAYRLRETDELVSNCHKVAADQFDKELLTADEIIAAVAETHAYLRRVNPKLRFVLTVSPVRHLKDTLVLNSASKAMLRVACHYLSELLPDVTYFPAYELLVDDLRDYRFYATDMLHLSESAENYVWDRFTRTYFDAAFGRFKKEWEGIRQNLGHRPLHAAAPEHRAFLESTLERLRKLSAAANVRMELLHVERELANLPEPKTTAPAEEEIYDDGEERIDIGSFDDQAATSKVQPATAPVVATTEADTKPEATKKGSAKKEINRAVFAKTRLTSQASLIRPGAGLLVEDAEETELEETDTTEATDSAASAELAYDHAYSPTITDLTDEAETDEDEADESEELGEPETAEEVARRKKRRSRGGAKRTKRKHARLAGEQGNIEGQLDASAVATAPAPLPDAPLPGTPATIVQPDDKEEPASEVVYITEAQLRQPRPQPTPPANSPTEPTSTDGTETATPEADETAPEARRSRNNRRGNKREQAPRYGGRPGRQPLYAVDTDGPAPVPADTASEATSTPAEGNTTEPVVPSPVVPAAVEASEKPAARQRAPRPKATRRPAVAPSTPAEPAPVEATPAVTTPAEAVSVATAASASPATLEPAAAKPTTRPSRRKPAAQPKAAPITVEEVAAAPEATAQPAPEPVKTPARKRAAAKPKAPAAPDAAVAPQATAVTESAPPKPAAPAKPVTKPKAPAKAKPKATAEATAKKTTKAAAKPKATADKAATDAKSTAAKSTPAKPKPAAKPTKKDKPEKSKA